MHDSASSLPRVLDVLRYLAAPLRGKTTRALIQINGGAAESAFYGFASSIDSLVGIAPGLHIVMQWYKYVFLTPMTGGVSLTAMRTATAYALLLPDDFPRIGVALERHRSTSTPPPLLSLCL